MTARDEQRKRLKQRRKDPLKQWKVSPIDQVALERWDDYTTARDTMLRRTDCDVSPWQVVRADDKKSARLNVIRHFLASVDCQDRREHLAHPDPMVVFPFQESLMSNGILAT